MEKGNVLVEWLLVVSLLLLASRLALKRMHFWHERLRQLDGMRLSYDGEKPNLVP